MMTRNYVLFVGCRTLELLSPEALDEEEDVLKNDELFRFSIILLVPLGDMRRNLTLGKFPD